MMFLYLYLGKEQVSFFFFVFLDSFLSKMKIQTFHNLSHALPLAKWFGVVQTIVAGGHSSTSQAVAKLTNNQQPTANKQQTTNNNRLIRDSKNTPILVLT